MPKTLASSELSSEALSSVTSSVLKTSKVSVRSRVTPAPGMAWTSRSSKPSSRSATLLVVVPSSTVAHPVPGPCQKLRSAWSKLKEPTMLAPSKSPLVSRDADATGARSVAAATRARDWVVR